MRTIVILSSDLRRAKACTPTLWPGP